jgi:CRISPR-associated protein Csb2
LYDACAGLNVLLAGKAGVLRLAAAEPDEHDPLFGSARIWTSKTRYRPTRHPQGDDSPEEAVIADLMQECHRRGLPRPEIALRDVKAGPRGGLSALARLQFQAAIRGPVLLGADSHFGAGLFAGSR